MGGTWPFTELVHAGVEVLDCEHKTPADAGSGYPYIAIPNVVDGRLDLTSVRLITEGDLESWTRRVVPREGDVVVTRRGRVGDTAAIPPGMRCAIGQNLVLLRSSGVAVSQEYLRWATRGPLWRSEVGRLINVGALFESLNVRDIPRLRIFVPPLSDQQAIVEVLGALDDKIALNKRIATTLRAFCRTSMESLWSAGHLPSLIDRDTTLPEGWRRTTLGRLCAAGGGGIQTGPFGSQLHASDYVESGIPSVMPQNIGDNVIREDGIARITSADAQRLSKYLLAEGDIVYSRRGDVKRRALVRKYEAGWLCGTGCLRVRVGTSTRPLFVSYYLGEPEIQDWIAQHAVGATMPNLNTSILGEVPVVLPPGDLVDRTHEPLAALDASAAQVMHENRTLAELRDTLLPRLVTGKIRVKDATRAVEEVV